MKNPWISDMWIPNLTKNIQKYYRYLKKKIAFFGPKVEKNGLK